LKTCIKICTFSSNTDVIGSQKLVSECEKLRSDLLVPMVVAPTLTKRNVKQRLTETNVYNYILQPLKKILSTVE